MYCVCQRIVGVLLLPGRGIGGHAGHCGHRFGDILRAVSVAMCLCGQRHKEVLSMKVVLIKSPRFLRGLLRLVFGIHKEQELT